MHSSPQAPTADINKLGCRTKPIHVQKIELELTNLVPQSANQISMLIVRDPILNYRAMIIKIRDRRRIHRFTNFIDQLLSLTYLPRHNTNRSHKSKTICGLVYELTTPSPIVASKFAKNPYCCGGYRSEGQLLSKLTVFDPEFCALACGYCSAVVVWSARPGLLRSGRNDAARSCYGKERSDEAICTPIGFRPLIKPIPPKSYARCGTVELVSEAESSRGGRKVKAIATAPRPMPNDPI